MTMPLLAAGHNGSFWMPVQASTFAGEVDTIFYFIYWLCVLFFFLIMGAVGYFAWAYRMKGPDDRTSPIRGNHRLEIIWSVIPSILLVVMFAWGFEAFMEQQRAPADAIDIDITGQKWSWTMTYENGGQDGNHLVVPVNQPVELTMHSVDVLHSFFIPAFRVKRDVLPNRYTTIWFEATQLGSFHIFCTEYCGDLHSNMIGTVDVVSQEEYDEYLSTLQGCAEGETLADCGARVYTSNGCNACHSVTGDIVIGPSFLGLFGTERNFEDGTTALADENYIRQSLMEPNSQVVQGFDPVMPTFAGRIDEDQLTALIAFIRSLNE
jgi:cytochrome c oxidase subunit 2